MWSLILRFATITKGALVVGVAASAAMVSSADVSNATHHETPSATASATTRPTSTPSSVTLPKPTEIPAVHSPSTTAPATTSPAPAKTDDHLTGLMKECREKYLALRAEGDAASHGDRESTTQVCKRALEESGLTREEFYKALGLDKVEPSKTEKHETTTRPELTDELKRLISECIAAYQAHRSDASDACRKAIAASGLTSAEFWAKFGPKTEPTTKPSHTPVDASTVEALVKDCFAKYTAKDPDTSNACHKAIEASGLTTDQFFAKFGKPTPPAKTSPSPSVSPQPATTTVGPITICLQLTAQLSSTSSQERINAASEACAKAMAFTGLSAQDFWAKFGTKH